MPHVLRFLFWSVGLAFVAWALKHLINEDDAPAPETIVNRLRRSGF